MGGELCSGCSAAARVTSGSGRKVSATVLVADAWCPATFLHLFVLSLCLKKRKKVHLCVSGVEAQLANHFQVGKLSNNPKRIRRCFFSTRSFAPPQMLLTGGACSIDAHALCFSSSQGLRPGCCMIRLHFMLVLSTLAILTLTFFVIFFCFFFRAFVRSFVMFGFLCSFP